MTRPHLIIKVPIPDPRIDNTATLDSAADLIQNVALTRILGQIVAKLIFHDFKEKNLFLLEHCHIEFVWRLIIS